MADYMSYSSCGCVHTHFMGIWAQTPKYNSPQTLVNFQNKRLIQWKQPHSCFRTMCLTTWHDNFFYVSRVICQLGNIPQSMWHAPLTPPPLEDIEAEVEGYEIPARRGFAEVSLLSQHVSKCHSPVLHEPSAITSSCRSLRLSWHLRKWPL